KFELRYLLAGLRQFGDLRESPLTCLAHVLGRFHQMMSQSQLPMIPAYSSAVHVNGTLTFPLLRWHTHRTEEQQISWLWSARSNVANSHPTSNCFPCD